MHTHIATLALALGATLTPVLANDIVTLLVPVLDQDVPIVGKLLGTQGSMTSYILNCPTAVPDQSCYFPEDGYTMAQGPSSFRWIYSSAGYSASQDCKILATTAVSCIVTMIEGDTTQVSKALATTDSLPYHRVTVTATVTQDDASTTATASGSAAAKGSPSGPSAAATGATTAATTGGTAAAATHTTSHNAAMAWATGSSVQWIAGGAAMGMVLAMV